MLSQLVVVVAKKVRHLGGGQTRSTKDQRLVLNEVINECVLRNLKYGRSKDLYANDIWLENLVKDQDLDPLRCHDHQLNLNSCCKLT